ncbi:MAG: hypothetical protein B7X07_05870 [Actinobacteria bacterium 21-64-8]|nr:MAG: hypothetical protein B7X07_05870 [Actinobacteria bacterium 21-64-8]
MLKSRPIPSYPQAFLSRFRGTGRIAPYADEAASPLIVTLADDAPGTATAMATGTVTVTEADILAAAGAVTISATEGAVFSGPLAAFTTTYAGSPASDFTATIDWGDGTTTAGSGASITETSGTLTVAGSHLYADEGSNTLTVILTDNSPGSATATATGTATVSEADTLAGVGTVAIGAIEGTAFSSTALATFTTTYTGSPASGFTATIDWGDGTMTAGSVSGSAGTLTVSGSHLYADELSAAPVSVTLTDGAPGSATATATGTATVSEADTLVAVSAATIGATEGTTFSSTALATFSTTYAANSPSDFTAVIDWGDGTTAAGTVSGSAGTLTVGGSHLYADELSAAPVSVTLSDNAPGSAAATATGTATVSEADALAAVSAATIGATEGSSFTGTVATFSTTYAANSPSDFRATIDWGDGTTAAGTVSGSAGTLTVSGSHLYADEAASPLIVTLADDAPGSATATATGTVTVTEADVLATAGAVTISATEGAVYSGPLATFTTTYAGSPTSGFTAVIDWGDGTTTSGSVSGAAGALTVSGSHLYADEGSNTLTVILTDGPPGTAMATATGTATVHDAALSATGSPVSATEGNTFSGTVATFTDANPAGTAADYTATIDWGDTSALTTVSGSQIATVGDSFRVPASHVYAEDGTYTLTVTMSDVGGATATVNPVATVGDAKLSATASAVSATEGSTFSGAVATFSDADPAGTATDYTATIDWGDTRGRRHL